MFNAPKIYPESVIRDAILGEDFHQYLIVNPLRPNETEELHSYAQLSVLLTLAAENFRAPSQKASEARETEVKELLEPLTRLTAKKGFQDTLGVASVGFG
jgi:hypothetical protein